MHRKTIDIGDNAGADTGWERGISVGRQTGYICANDGCAGRALGGY
jgi:hypothetical protein